MTKLLSVVLLISMFVGPVFSQGTGLKGEKAVLKKAEYYFFEEDFQNYSKALELFKKLEKHRPSDPYYKLMVGVCYIQFGDTKEKGLKQLQEVKKEYPEFNMVNYYIAKAFTANYRFDEAIEMYRKYLKSDLITDAEKEDVRQNIIYCQNAKKYQGEATKIEESEKIDILNIGYPINTKYSEYVPTITPDESMMIYTYRGEKSKGGLMDQRGKPDSDGQYYEDIMITYKVNDEWLDPKGIGANINTMGQDASISLSVDGQQLFIYKSTNKDHGDIYLSTLEGDEWSVPKRLKGGVNTESWEGSASLVSGGQVLYFVSDREGGYGGRDLYSAKLQPDSTWGEVKNLGPTINTKMDDDAPAIHPDKRTLYYSSKGHTSMGGYDIFYSYLNDDGWDEPVNVGSPVNTIGDDRFYVLSADGKTGYYSTAGRSNDGTHDIFMVKPGHFGRKPVLALVIGVVTDNEKPLEADITVSNDKTGKVEGVFESNATTGKYILSLTPGNKYKIAVEVEGYETQTQYLNVQSVDAFIKVDHDIKFKPISSDSETAIYDEGDDLQDKIDKQIEQYNYENTKKGYEATALNTILEKHGDKVTENVEYFLDFEEISVNKKMLEIKSKLYEKKDINGFKKTVIGPFKTIREADAYKKLLMSKDSTLSDLKLKVNDKGNEKTLRDYYPSEYSRTKFLDDQTTEDKGMGEKDPSSASDIAVKGISYKIEIAAVTDSNDFQLDYLSKYGEISSKVGSDGKIHYTLGPFNTLRNAENFKKMLADKEPKTRDAFITVFVFGKRKTLEEFKEDPPAIIEEPQKEVEEEEVIVEKVVVEKKERVVKKAIVEVITQEVTKEQLIEEEEVIVEKVVVEKKERVVKEAIVEEITQEVTKEQLIEEQKVATKVCENNAFVDFSWFVGKDLNDVKVYNKLLETGGKLCAEGLVFKVQIAAYRFPKNYKWDHLKQYGNPRISNYSDKITRFTQGIYKTLEEAEVLRKKIIKAGQVDAWITPFYNGKRMLMQDLIDKNFYGKSLN